MKQQARSIWRYTFWLGLWFLLTTTLVFVFKPRPILELPIDTAHGSQYGIGFSEDGLSFITAKITDVKEWNAGDYTAWNLITGEATSLGHHRLKSSEGVDWHLNLPPCLDGLVINQNEQGWVIKNSVDQSVLLKSSVDDTTPRVIRRSNDKRWLALETAYELEIHDLTHKYPLRKFPSKKIIQFTPDSKCLLCGAMGENENLILQSITMETCELKWANRNLTPTVISSYLANERARFAFANAKFGMAGNSDSNMSITLSSDKDFHPFQFGSGQGFLRVEKAEWKSPIADWLMKKEWYGFGSGRTWLTLSIIDLQTGSDAGSPLVRSLNNLEYFVSKDGKHLAIQLRDKPPYHDRWIIYALPVRTGWFLPLAIATGITLSLWLLRGIVSRRKILK